MALVSEQKKPALVIMAAGMGSRFGGLKQIIPVGPSGERIIDYSIYDALAAGFERIVFVIKKEIEETFKEQIGNRIEKIAPVDYVFQEIDRLPPGFSVPDERTKPWGTGHAVLSCLGTVNQPFAVINADDYYGRDCYSLLYSFLTNPQDDDRLHIAMAGYVLENTLTENGYVSRGICSVNEDNMLCGLVERTHIELVNGAPMYTEDDSETWVPLPRGCQVSMNCWAFPAATLAHFERLFATFLSTSTRLDKAEFYLPFAVDNLVREQIADVRVLKTTDRWYGMTYQQDREQVISAIGELISRGMYPERLWKD